MVAHSEFGYLPMCTPAEGKPWFAGSVSVGYSAMDARTEFTKMVHGQKDYIPSQWEDLKKDGWRIVRVKVSAT